MESNVVSRDLESICKSLQSELAEMEGKTIYITGGGGFLGYYLVQVPLYWNEHFAKGKPIRVIASDNYKVREPAWISTLPKKNLEFMRLDATKGLPENLDANYIFHCASIASPIFYRKYPIETIDANITGLRLLLDYALQNPQKVKSILYFSSSEIYGDPSPDQIPTSEEYCGNVSCVGPRACYDESKRLCETLCYSYFRQHNVPVKIVRPFNNFGPGLFPDDGRVLADFANAVISGKPITLLSSGKPSRTFCYIADAITGYYKALVRGRPAEAYNIGTETPEISMRELAEMFVSIATKEFGYNGKIEFSVSEDKDYLTHNPNRRSPKIDKARRELGYEPQVALRQGISNYIRWAKETH